jgi:crotonobetainyl-CoA:carnitine CoA-transferase CaiB-like acyl-CoA transferase
MAAEAAHKGPLAGIRIVELTGLGPCPMAAMLLADLGATVLRIDRTTPAADLGLKRPRKFNVTLRNRPAIGLDLKRPDAVDLALRLVADANALIEGFRPGVMERLGLGPDACLARNPRLVYGRITGWGQHGPLAQAAGHDLNYVALTGALHAMGRKGEPPAIPLSIIGDYGGGALYLAFGVLAGILSAQRTGKGQVVDAAMVDGVVSMLSVFYGMLAGGIWNPERGTNPTDSGSHFVNVYECADGKWVAISPVEARFHRELLQRLEIDPDDIGDQLDPANWPKAKEILARRFKTRTRDEWCATLETSDSCVAPVLAWSEAPRHPHLRARDAFVELEGVTQPAPAPHFSGTPFGTPKPVPEITAENTRAALAGWLTDREIAALRRAGTIG